MPLNHRRAAAGRIVELDGPEMILQRAPYCAENLQLASREADPVARVICAAGLAWTCGSYDVVALPLPPLTLHFAVTIQHAERLERGAWPTADLARIIRRLEAFGFRRSNQRLPGFAEAQPAHGSALVMRFDISAMTQAVAAEAGRLTRDAAEAEHAEGRQP